MALMKRLYQKIFENMCLSLFTETKRGFIYMNVLVLRLWILTEFQSFLLLLALLNISSIWAVCLLYSCAVAAGFSFVVLSDVV